MADRWTHPMPRWLFWPVLILLLGPVPLSCCVLVGLLLQLEH
jgi:hypothetical protein